MALEAIGLGCGYAAKFVLRDVHFAIEPGELVCLLGPNGVGKTTLFRTLLGILKPLCGVANLDGCPISAISPAMRARKLAYVPQVGSMTFSYTAREVAMMGRAPWLRLHDAPSNRDCSIVDEVFEKLSLSGLKSRPFVQLSSGEKQLVLIARALVQSPRYLVLDEPMSNLDFGNQSRMLEQLDKLRCSGIGILMTTHHPNHAFDTKGRVLMIDRSRRLHVGSAHSVLTAENLSATYGVEVTVLRQRLRSGDERSCCVTLRESERL